MRTDFGLYQIGANSSPLSFAIGGLRCDPFDAFPIGAKDGVPEAVDYWINVWAPAQVSVYVPLDAKNALISLIFKMAVQNEAAFASLVAMVQSFSVLSGRGQLEPSKEVLYHQSKAINSLRKTLSSSPAQVDDGTLLGTLHLMTVDMVYGDVASFQSHCNGFRHMMATQASSVMHSHLHGIIGYYLAASQFYFRLMDYHNRQLTPPQSPNNDGIPNSSDQQRQLFAPSIYETIFYNFSDVPHGFRALARDKALSINLFRLLCRMSKSIIIIQSAESSSMAVAPTDTSRIWLFEPWEDVETALTCLEALPPRNSHQTTIEHCLCLALMPYSIDTHMRFHSTRIYWRLLQDLMSAIDDFVPRTVAERDCLVWISVVAVSCSANGDGSIVVPAVHRNRIIDRMLEEKEQLRSWHGLKGTLEGFFWNEHQLKAWWRCWRAGMDRRRGKEEARPSRDQK